MLYSLDTHSYIDDDYIPHKQNYETCRARLTDAEYKAIRDDLASRIQGDEIITSSWIPGSDWSDTVFQPIYEKACRKDVDAAARFFGLLVWEVVRDNDRVWSFGRYEKDGIPIEGLTYFKLSSRPPRR